MEVVVAVAVVVVAVEVVAVEEVAWWQWRPVTW